MTSSAMNGGFSDQMETSLTSSEVRLPAREWNFLVLIGVVGIRILWLPTGRSDSPPLAIRMRKTTLQASSKRHPTVARLMQSIDRLEADKLEQLWRSIGHGEEPIESSIIRSGLADEWELAESFSQHYLAPLFRPLDGEPLPVDPNVASVLPADYCREKLVAPLCDADGTLEVAVCYPASLQCAEEINQLTGRIVRPLFTTRGTIEAIWAFLYDSQSHEPPDTKHPPAVVEFVVNMLSRAVAFDAFAVQLDRKPDGCRVSLHTSVNAKEIEPPGPTIVDGVFRYLNELARTGLPPSRGRLPDSFRLRIGDRRYLATLSRYRSTGGHTVKIELRTH